MSATGTRPAPARDPADTLCAQCGAELADDQEWCLECGGARTLIHRAPDWRISAAVIALVVAVVLGGFVAALIALSNDASRQPTVATQTRAANTPTLPAGIASWPAGLPGWTVVLASSHKRAVAYADAARVAAAGIEVGVLNSSQHPKLAPHYWVVFSGRYPSRPQALASATKLIGLGQTSAHPRLVGRPGVG